MSAPYYFYAYGQLDSHENMLKDSARTLAYKRAIEMNKHLFKDKIVMDVGCGSGILSLFAASAGAKTVIAIDASEIIHCTKKIVAANGFSEVIHVIHSEVEKIDELPNKIQEIDIIISEWMGFSLYHESMLGTVLYARDKWLKSDGLIFPDQVTLYLAAFTDKNKIDAYEKIKNIRGFKTSALHEHLFQDATVCTIEPGKVCSTNYLISKLDLYTATSDYSFTMKYQLRIQKSCYLTGFFTYFDVHFTKCHKLVTLSTSPTATPTHWQQTTFLLNQIQYVNPNDSVSGTIQLTPFKKSYRDLSISIQGLISIKDKGDDEVNFNLNYVVR